MENLPVLVSNFLHEQLHHDSESVDSLVARGLLRVNGLISVFHSAVVTFYAPSDLSGVGGMHSEWICSASNWRKKHPRHDTVLMEKDPDM